MTGAKGARGNMRDGRSPSRTTTRKLALLPLLAAGLLGVAVATIPPPPTAPARAFRKALASEAGPQLPRPAIRLRARVDPEARRISGDVRIRFPNLSDSPLSSILLDAGWNAFSSPTSTFLALDPPLARRLERTDGWGFCRVVSARVDGRPARAPGPAATPDGGGRPPDGTVLELRLDRPLPVGETVELELLFESRIPVGVPYAGLRDRFLLAAGGFFPRPSPLDPSGWRARQRHRFAEPSGDPADWRVELDLPEGTVLAAAGVAESPPIAPSPGRRLHRLAGERIADFAFAADPRFLHLTHEIPGLAGESPLLVELFLQPEHASQGHRILRAARSAVEEGERLLGRWPWSRLVLVDPRFRSRGEGREFPTLVTLGTSLVAPEDRNHPEALIFHEIFHQWFHALAPSNETDEAWVDEGPVTWLAARSVARTIGPDRWAFPIAGWPIVVDSRPLPFPWDAPPRSDLPPPDPRLASWRQPAFGPYHAASYLRPAAAFEAVARRFGDEPVERALALHVAQGKFRRRSGRELLSTLEEVIGSEARRHFERVAFGSSLPDFAVVRCESVADPAGGWTSRVAVERRGSDPAPVEIEFRFADGGRVVRVWDAGGPIGSWEVRGPRLVEAWVDPRGWYPLDPTPLDRSARPDPDRSIRFAWGSRLLGWIQLLAEMGAFLS